MTPQKEQNNTCSIDKDFLQAEQFINQALAGMDDETHIEYGSTMERKGTPSMWKQWLHRLIRLLNRPERT